MAETKTTRSMSTEQGCGITITHIKSEFGDGVSFRVAPFSGEAREYACGYEDAVMLHEMLGRALGCRCQLEQGDSPCPVHGDDSK